MAPWKLWCFSSEGLHDSDLPPKGRTANSSREEVPEEAIKAALQLPASEPALTFPHAHPHGGLDSRLEATPMTTPTPTPSISVSRTSGSMLRGHRKYSAQVLEDAVEAMDPRLLDSMHMDDLDDSIGAMRWIGQGGGGAVYTGVWQGALVAVKFMLAQSLGHVRYGALEAIVSQALLHPNIVTCYSADVLRITPSSFCHDQDVRTPGGPRTPRSNSFSANFSGTSRGSSRNASQDQCATFADNLAPKSPRGAGHGGGDQGGQPSESGGGASPRRQLQAQKSRAGSLHKETTTRAASPPAPMACEALFQSGDGFGDPDVGAGQSTMKQVLTNLNAKEGMHLTMMILEYCDRGSLLDNLRGGIFRVPTPSAALSNATSQPFHARVILRAVLRTARDVARGMQHLHTAGIIHGDLKPGNVLLQGSRSDRRGFVAKVADFGLSKLIMSDVPLETHQWTTITAMSPEMIQGRCMKASDVWAFGVLLWQMVTSELNPYGNRTVAQILLGVGHQGLQPAWPSDTHPALLHLGQTCLYASPERRPTFVEIDRTLTSIEKVIRLDLQQQQIQQQQAQLRREQMLQQQALAQQRGGESSASRETRAAISAQMPSGGGSSDARGPSGHHEGRFSSVEW